MLFQYLDKVGNSLEENDYSDESVPANIGLCLLAFDSESIYKLESLFRKNDIRSLCSPQLMEGDLFGDRRVMTVKALGGFMLKFTENPNGSYQ